MLKLLRTLLYWLARVAGVIGLVAGGKSLGKYALARLNDPYFDSFSYNDLVFSGGVIFLLSLLVLIFADVGHSLGKNSRPFPAENSGEKAKPAPPPAKTTGPAPLISPAPGSEPEGDRESADEKLERLLKQKNEFPKN
jgi:hypothetical protein